MAHWDNRIQPAVMVYLMGSDDIITMKLVYIPHHDHLIWLITYVHFRETIRFTENVSSQNIYSIWYKK